ncbi:MAG: hypothetical protein QG632_414 [Candidatus Dependentiae bacterium]|nr:hypothetical protein [Candidatus Dependentiae bacterium]
MYKKWGFLIVGVILVGASVGEVKANAAVTAPGVSGAGATLPVTNTQASDQAAALLAANPYEGASHQKQLAETDAQKVDAVFKRDGGKIKALAYKTGRLSWQGVKAAAKLVRKLAGVGISFAAQIFKMVVFYCCFNATMAVVVPKVLTRI